MTYKFELFLVIQKKGLINTKSFKLSSSNFIYSVRYMNIFFMIYLYWIIRFLD